MHVTSPTLDHHEAIAPDTSGATYNTASASSATTAETAVSAVATIASVGCSAARATREEERRFLAERLADTVAAIVRASRAAVDGWEQARARDIAASEIGAGRAAASCATREGKARTAPCDGDTRAASDRTARSTALTIHSKV